MVDEQHRHFAAVTRVDQAGAVHHPHAMAKRMAAARKDEAGVTLGNGHGQAGRHCRSLSRSDAHLGARHEIPACIPGMGLRRRR
jgi:hypothetical protein